MVIYNVALMWQWIIDTYLDSQKNLVILIINTLTTIPSSLIGMEVEVVGSSLTSSKSNLSIITGE